MINNIKKLVVYREKTKELLKEIASPWIVLHTSPVICINELRNTGKPRDFHAFPSIFPNQLLRRRLSARYFLSNLKTDKDFEFNVDKEGAVDLIIDFDLNQSMSWPGRAHISWSPVLHLMRRQMRQRFRGQLIRHLFTDDDHHHRWQQRNTWHPEPLGFKHG